MLARLWVVPPSEQVGDPILFFRLQQAAAPMQQMNSNHQGVCIPVNQLQNKSYEEP
jgi:hypothetical protein